MERNWDKRRKTLSECLFTRWILNRKVRLHLNSLESRRKDHYQKWRLIIASSNQLSLFPHTHKQGLQKVAAWKDGRTEPSDFWQQQVLQAIWPWGSKGGYHPGAVSEADTGMPVRMLTWPLPKTARTSQKQISEWWLNWTHRWWEGSVEKSPGNVS